MDCQYLGWLLQRSFDRSSLPRLSGNGHPKESFTNNYGGYSFDYSQGLFSRTLRLSFGAFWTGNFPYAKSVVMVPSFGRHTQELTPCDFYLCGTVEDKVFATSSTTRSEFNERILQALRSLEELLTQNVLEELIVCITGNGAAFEHLLWQPSFEESAITRLS